MNEISDDIAALQAETRHKILAVVEAEVAEIAGKRRWMRTTCLVLSLFGAWLVLGANSSLASVPLVWLVSGSVILLVAAAIPQQIPNRIRIVGTK